MNNHISCNEALAAILDDVVITFCLIHPCTVKKCWADLSSKKIAL